MIHVQARPEKRARNTGPDMAQSGLWCSLEQAEVDETASLVLTTRALDGTTVYRAGVTVAITLATGGTAGISISTVVDNLNGTYTCVATGTTAGTARTFVATVGELTVASTMPTMTVNVPSVVAAIFSDNFNTGVLAADANGYGHKRYPTAGGGTMPVATATVDGAVALKFSFGSPVTERSKEHNFHMNYPDGVSELWMQYNLYIPSNYYCPNSVNHFFEIWGPQDYSNSHGCFKLGLTLYPAGTGDADDLYFGTGWFEDTAGANEPREFTATLTTSYITDSGPVTRGAWSQVRWHIKTSSAAGAADGVFENWVNGTLIYAQTSQVFWYPRYVSATGTGYPGYFKTTRAGWGTNIWAGKVITLLDAVGSVVLVATCTSNTSQYLYFTSGDATGAYQIDPTAQESPLYGSAATKLLCGYLWGSHSYAYTEPTYVWVDDLTFYNTDPGW